MVAVAREISLEELRTRIGVLLDRLEHDPVAPKSFTISDDFYWTFSMRDALDMSASPILEVGSLADDIEHLDVRLELVTSLELEAAASLLRYYSRLI